MGEFALGQAVPRFEDPRLLRGGGRYVDDMVLPRMAFGHVLRSPHAHARIRSIDATAAKAAPGVLAVLTGADWEASGWGDLPSAAGQQAARRLAGLSAALPGIGQGPGALGRRLRRLCRRRERASGGGRGRTDRGRVRAAAGDRLDRGRDRARRAARSGTTAPTTSPLSISKATRRRPTPPSPRAAHVVRHRFVINRVTAATMEPRGCIGDYNPAADHYTIYTTLQRTHAYRSELARQILKVPESKVRVVAGDIGGSFGMKSAIYNEVALVLLASKLTGGRSNGRARAPRPSSATRRPATTSPRPSWRSTPTAIFSGLRVAHDRRRRRLSAGRLQRLCRQSRNLGRRLPHAGGAMPT